MDAYNMVDLYGRVANTCWESHYTSLKRLTLSRYHLQHVHLLNIQRKEVLTLQTKPLTLSFIASQDMSKAATQMYLNHSR